MVHYPGVSEVEMVHHPWSMGSQRGRDGTLPGASEVEMVHHPWSMGSQRGRDGTLPGSQRGGDGTPPLVYEEPAR